MKKVVSFIISVIGYAVLFAGLFLSFYICLFFINFYSDPVWPTEFLKKLNVGLVKSGIPFFKNGVPLQLIAFAIFLPLFFVSLVGLELVRVGNRILFGTVPKKIRKSLNFDSKILLETNSLDRRIERLEELVAPK